jgi:glycosyltransferase involved in cell wall biosynthesis
MKFAIVRTASQQIRLDSYNVQEIGLAKSMLNHGISTDIYTQIFNVNSDTIIAQKNNDKVTIKPIKGIHVFREIMFYPNLKFKLCNGGYDIVQLIDDSQAMIPFLLVSLKKYEIKTILWQGMYKNFPGRIASLMQLIYDSLFSKIINKYSDIKIAKTTFAKQYLEEKKYKNIIVLPVGLDFVQNVRNMGLDKKIKTFKEKYPFILLYIGSIEQRRNVNFIIDVIIKINRMDVGLILVGDGKDYTKITKKICDSRFEDKILQFKHIPNNQLISIYENSSVFLLPTNYEIYGMVIMEALFFGLPVISTPEAGPYSLLKDDILGCCLELDVEQWKERIEYYFTNKNTEYESMYRKKEIENNYRWDKIAEKYSVVLETITSCNNIHIAG